MARLSPAATLLTLFTSPEEALSIEGDLLEESRTRGRSWFWTHVVGTTLALGWKGVRTPSLAFAIATLAILGAGFLAARVAESDDSPGFFVLATLATGFLCARALPTRGIVAAFAVAALAGPLVLGVSALLGSPVHGIADRILAFASGLPLLLGAVVGRRQVVRKAARA